MHSPSPSPDASKSLDSLLSLFTFSSVSSLLEAETHALTTILSSIYQEIHHRKTLESELLSIIEYRELYLDSRKHNLRPYEIPADASQLYSIEKNLITLEQERIHTRQTTAQDLLELKKISWHYFLALHRKAFVIRFLR